MVHIKGRKGRLVLLLKVGAHWHTSILSGGSKSLLDNICWKPGKEWAQGFIIRFSRCDDPSCRHDLTRMDTKRVKVGLINTAVKNIIQLIGNCLLKSINKQQMIISRIGLDLNTLNNDAFAIIAIFIKEIRVWS
jgi:hypothetical protein